MASLAGTESERPLFFFLVDAGSLLVSVMGKEIVITALDLDTGQQEHLLHGRALAGRRFFLKYLAKRSQDGATT